MKGKQWFMLGKVITKQEYPVENNDLIYNKNTQSQASNQGKQPT